MDANKEDVLNISHISHISHIQLMRYVAKLEKIVSELTKENKQLRTELEHTNPPEGSDGMVGTGYNKCKIKEI